MSIFSSQPKRYYEPEVYEWLEILKATEDNPTLKDAADQLRVLYNTSKELTPTDENYESILDPTQSGVWKGLILG